MSDFSVLSLLVVKLLKIVDTHCIRECACACYNRPQTHIYCWLAQLHCVQLVRAGVRVAKVYFTIGSIRCRRWTVWGAEPCAHVHDRQRRTKRNVTQKINPEQTGWNLSVLLRFHGHERERERKREREWQ